MAACSHDVTTYEPYCGIALLRCKKCCATISLPPHTAALLRYVLSVTPQIDLRLERVSLLPGS